MIRSRYSYRHKAYYSNMAKEMLKYAGFQESINDVLREISMYGGFDSLHRKWCDDLYDVYGNSQVTE